jgi:hypothetical protein
MTMQLVIELLFTPLCAMLAGAIIWLMYRGESLDDAVLIRNFVILLVVFSASGYAFLRTDGMRMRLEPAYRIQREIEGLPLYVTMAQHAPSDAEALSKLLAAEMAAGASLPEALQVARPMLWRELKYRSGFADQAMRLEYARYITDTLKEFQASDPALCHRILTHQPLDRATLLQKFTPENAAAFHVMASHVYESADRGMRNERNPNEKTAEFNTVALQYREIQEEIEERFGEDVAALLRPDRIASAPASSAARLCKARIYQLEAMQKRPKEIASRLTDSILRS